METFTIIISFICGSLGTLLYRVLNSGNKKEPIRIDKSLIGSISKHDDWELFKGTHTIIDIKDHKGGVLRTEKYDVEHGIRRYNNLVHQGVDSTKQYLTF